MKRAGGQRIDSTIFHCHSRNVTVFNFDFRRGTPIFEQVVLAAIAAIIRREYLPGQTFPSVRVIAADLKIHPNTAHKVIQHLVAEKWLEARPGIGTVVADRAANRGEEWRTLLQLDVQRLLQRAQSIGASLPDVIDELTHQWNDAKPSRNKEPRDHSK
jgi:GntR family transcriptional regulator